MLCDWFLERVARYGMSLVTGPAVVRLRMADNVSPALRSRSRGVPFRCACGDRIVRLRPFQPFRCRVLLAVDLWADGVEATPRDLGHRGGVATGRHDETVGGLRASAKVVKANERLGLSGCPGLSLAVKLNLACADVRCSASA